jgi:DNA-binding response OmpR family regulator
VDGFEICRQLKKESKTKDTKILAITAYDTQEHREKIKQAGVDDYFAKPLDVSVLEEKINNLVKLPKKTSPQAE